jgi:hypothetical protein
MSNFQVRGCCCGIPFGCGVLLVVLFSAFLWGLAVPGSFWHAAGKGLALIVMPGLVLALAAGAGVRRG